MANEITDYTERVTAAVRAELARRGLDRLALAPVMNLERNAVYARFRGEKSFTMNDLSNIAKFLGIDETVLTNPPAFTIPETSDIQTEAVAA